MPGIIYSIPLPIEMLKLVTSSVWVWGCLVVLSRMVWNSRDDDNSVIVVGEGLVVAVGDGGGAADG